MSEQDDPTAIVNTSNIESYIETITAEVLVKINLKQECARPLGPSGIPFKEFAEKGQYLVDKSMLIADVLKENPRGVFLYVRPHRFGKTTNLTMLDAFLNMEYAGNDWFDGLAVSEHHELDPYRNAFPVISVSLKDVDGSSFESFLDGMTRAVEAAYSKHEDVVEGEDAPMLTRITRRAFRERNVSEMTLIRSLRALSETLAHHHGRKVVVLIDDYDVPVTGSRSGRDAEAIASFLVRFLSSTLKDNPNLQLAYLTGTEDAGLSERFRGPYMIVDDDAYDGMFGFTGDEVGEMLEHLGRPEMLGPIMERCGTSGICCPCDVLDCVSNGVGPSDRRRTHERSLI